MFLSIRPAVRSVAGGASRKEKNHEMVSLSIEISMKTVIYTSIPCIIKFGNLQEMININENLQIDEDFKKLDVYPTDRGRISFQIDLSQHEANFYRIIERNHKRLIFILDGLYAQNADVYEFEYNKIRSKVEIYSDKIIFSGEKNKKIIHLNQKYNSYKYGNFKFIDYCILENLNGEKTLILYNASKNNSKVYFANNIEENEDGFTLYNTAFGYSSISQKLYIDEEGLKTQKKEFTTIAASSSLEETLPYQFLNSIKLSDYENALKMLSPRLGDRLTDQALKKYFGNISYFYMIDSKSAYAISDDKNKIFEFSVKDNKIDEISSE